MKMHAPDRFKIAVRHRFGRLAVAGATLLAALAPGVADAVISQTPMFMAQQPKPNIMFTMDDSGSMAWNCVPDSLCPRDRHNNPESFDFTNTANTESICKWRSTRFNGLAYDPAIRYRPWQKADGTYYPNSTPFAALDDPTTGVSATYTNLIGSDESTTYRHVDNGNHYGWAINNRGNNGNHYGWTRDTNSSEPFLAFYYTTCAATPTTRVEIRSTTAPSTPSTWPKSTDRSDCVAVDGSCTYGEEIQNFANWYTYYRTRITTAIAGISQAFNPLDGDERVGYGEINSGSKNVDGVANSTVVLGVRDFVGTTSGTGRYDFYDRLFRVRAGGGTALRRSLDDVGQYFMRTDNKGPWGENPGVSKGTEYACRKNFHILMTDGYWNGSAASAAGADNANSTDGPSYTNPKPGSDSFRYLASTAKSWYRGSGTGTLSDVAMHYWRTDLRTDLANIVPTVGNNEMGSDPAYWQHIVQYTVGLGVDGTLDWPTDKMALWDGTKVWPNPGEGENPQAVDDLWHAAVNGRGDYFSAKDPTSFRQSLTNALNAISKQAGAASTVAINFNKAANSGVYAFVPSFEAGSWLGHLKAFRVNTDGVVTNDMLWNAAQQLPAWSARRIYTWKPTAAAAAEFTWANLEPEQQAALGNADVLEYIRGNGAKEKSQSNGIYRERATKLGDIVNSSPIYVRQADFGYDKLGGTEGSTYRSYYLSQANRSPMLYVGANDGMLHGFSADTGVETFAYVPASVVPNLHLLTADTYRHRYFVDGQLVASDAHNGSAWKTVLVGSVGAGGKGMFAVDVTTPATRTTTTSSGGASSVTETPALAASNVLWERTGSADANMGSMLGKAVVVKMSNGEWAAVYGNGYDSANKRAVLYIVNAFTGALIRAIDTGAGGVSAPNGLSSPAILYNKQRRAVAAYAGDLRGNLWKFDLSSGTASEWAVAYGAPLFSAKDGQSTPAVQPIIQRPALAGHPNGGYMVMFGTGKYFETADTSDNQVQTVYGIWDKPEGSAITDARGTALVQQTLTGTNTSSGGATVADGGATLTTLTVDWASKRGWFVNLTLGSGERAVGDPFITDESTVWFTTLDPVSDPCIAGGDSRLMGIRYLTGGAQPNPIFDTNGDGAIANPDTNKSVIKIGGTVSNAGVIKVPRPTGENAPCGVAGKPACHCGEAGQPPCPACSGESRKIIVNKLDGTTTDVRITAACRPPLRTWHELQVPY